MTVIENEEIKLLWDFCIQTEMKIKHNKPDLVLLYKKARICYIIDVACPFDTRVEKKEKENFEHYINLEYELLKSLEHGSNENVHNTNCPWHIRNSHKEYCKISRKD